MVVQNKEKNREYVAKHRAKKQASDKEAYNEVNADYILKHREVLEEKIGEEEYKKQEREKKQAYRAKLKQNIKHIYIYIYIYIYSDICVRGLTA